MSSGTISGTTSSSSVLSRIRWTCAIDIATNTSVVTAQLEYRTTSNWHRGTFEGYLWIDGTRFECQKDIVLQPDGSWVTVGTHSKTIQHNTDGTKSIEIYATGGISGTAFNATKCSAIVTLETIPRTTTPTTSGTFNVGSSVTISLPRAADSFTHTVQYSLNATDWTTIATGVATSTAWTLPASLATALPNATSGTVYLRAITYSGGTEIGSETISRTYYITSAYAAPSASIAISQSNSANIGQYIRGKSTVTLTAKATSLKHGATAVRYAFTYGGVTQTVTSSATSASVSFALPSNAAASYAYSVTLTDSRGYTASASGSVTTVAYSAPAISSLTATRGNYNGSTFTANDTGKSLKIVASGTITSLSNANAKNYALEYRLQTATAYSALVSTTTASSYSFSLTYYTTAIFSEYSAYTIKLTLSDSFGSTAWTVNVTSKQVVLNFNAEGTAMGIGTIAGESGALKVGWDLIPFQPLCPANLLDNSYFAGSDYVNQRGRGSTQGDWQYCIDRWVATTKGSNLVWHDSDHLAIYDGDNVVQVIEPNKIKIGTAYTLACKIKDGATCAASGIVASNNEYSINLPVKGAGMQLYSVNNGYWYVRIFGQMAGTFLKLDWIALYEGTYTADTLPAYQPKGYAHELAECRRYYENSWYPGGRNLVNQMQGLASVSYVDAYVSFKQTKRVQPTVTLHPESNEHNYTDWTYYNGAYKQASAHQVVMRGGRNGFMTRLTPSSGDNLTIGYSYAVNGHWEASADL